MPWVWYDTLRDVVDFVSSNSMALTSLVYAFCKQKFENYAKNIFYITFLGHSGLIMPLNDLILP